MIRSLVFSGLAAASLLLLSPLRPGRAEALHYQPRETRLPPSGVAVPMEFVDRLPLVEVRINGEGPYLFILDTGASLAALNRPVAAGLDLEPSKSADVADNSGAAGRIANVVELEAVEMEGARFAGVDAVVVDLDFVVGANQVIDGLLGFGLFADCLLTLDFPQRSIRLERGELEAGDPRSVLDYMNVQGAPRLTLRLADHMVRVTVDSGANGCLTLPRSLRRKLPFHAPPVAMGRVQRTHGEGPAQLARVAGSLEIGRHEVVDPLVRLFGRSGVLGNQVLQHFAVTFDQKNARVRFAREPAEPITIPGLRSRGFHTEEQGGARIVVEVIADTLAAELGIRVRDRIMRVNGRPYADLGPGEWLALWNHDQPLRLTLGRGTDTLEVAVPLIELVP